MHKRSWMLVSLILVFAVILGACAAPAAAPEEKPAVVEEAATEAEVEAPAEKLKVAFIYIGQPGDLGWTYEHDRGRLMLEEALGDQVETIFIPDVPEGPDAEKTIRDVVEAGAKVVFTTSFGYMDPTATVAADYPDVVFEHCSGYVTADNLAT